MQTEVDDSGSQAESNQGDRSPALRGNRTQVFGEVTANLSKSVRKLAQPLPVCTLQFPHSEVSVIGIRTLAYAGVSSSGVGFL